MQIKDVSITANTERIPDGEVSIMTKQRGINKSMLKAAILVLTFSQMATNGLSPAMADIAAQFPDAATSTIQFLMTLPGIFVVILSLISAWLTSIFPKVSDRDRKYLHYLYGCFRSIVSRQSADFVCVVISDGNRNGTDFRADDFADS